MRDLTADQKRRVLLIENLIELLSNQQHVSDESLEVISGLTIKRLEELFSPDLPTNCFPVWTKMQLYAIHHVGYRLFQDYEVNGNDEDGGFVEYVSKSLYEKSPKTLIYRSLFDRVLYYTDEFCMGDFKKYLSISKQMFVADVGIHSFEREPKQDNILQDLRVILAQSFLTTQGSSMLLGELLQPVFEEDLEKVLERLREGR